MEKLLRRPEMTWQQLAELSPALRQVDYPAAVIDQVVVETKYSGYIERQAAEIDRHRRLDAKRIPEHFDFSAIPQLRHEAREKFARIRPTSIGQAGRISGITPSDLAVVMIYLEGRQAVASR